MKRFANLAIGLLLGLGIIAGLRAWTHRKPAPEAAANGEPASIPLVAATPTRIQKTTPPRLPSNEAIATLEDFLKAQDPGAEWKIHMNSEGRPFGIMGGKMTVPQGPSGLQDLVESLAPYLIGQSPELIAVETPVEGPVADVQTFEQRAAGYRVYGAVVKTSVLKNTGEVIEVSSDLRPITNVDTQIATTREQAEAVLRQKYQGFTRFSGDPEALVFGTTPVTNVLAWKFFVTFEKPKYVTREVMVSARDGRVLRDRPVSKR